MSRQEIYQKITANLGMMRDEVWSFENELIDEILEMLVLLSVMDREKKDVL